MTATQSTDKRPDSTRTADAKARSIALRKARTVKAVIVTLGGAK